jgi:hypothetical protein
MGVLAVDIVPSGWSPTAGREATCQLAVHGEGLHRAPLLTTSGVAKGLSPPTNTTLRDRPSSMGGRVTPAPAAIAPCGTDQPHMPR